MSRDVWVDNAKGIGIILVVYGHVARGLHSAGIWSDATSFSFLDSAVYSFHMPLFFFLSGLYFLNLSDFL
ncbi:acyltransferase family protein, partial [Cupriavidus sp. WS]|uniref:acyltransferase family protein n=1 Tax=Cupriavidus sp. WS TaxID=1312922 RepID=UPI0005B9F13F